jgi:hypothetical protein
MSSKHPLPAPDDVTLPFFSYGVFKPGEFAYRQLESLVDDRPESATVSGSLWLRDGLPLLEPGTEGSVAGCLLEFKPGKEADAYALVSKVEPGEHYEWMTVEVTSAGKHRGANALRGLLPSEFSAPFEGYEWTGRQDPVFNEAIKLLHESVKEHAETKFVSVPPESLDWNRFYRLQMAYLLLWSAIERFAALAYGPRLAPTQKVAQLGGDPLFGKALGSVSRTGRVCDSRDPKAVYTLDRTNPKSSAEYYYQVRCNLSHRGKGAWGDAELVRTSLKELLSIFESMLKPFLQVGPDCTEH